MSVEDELIDRFLDGDVSQNEADQVVRWLESPANLQRFAQRAELHADLRSSLRRRSVQDLSVAKVAKTFGSANRNSWRVLLQTPAIAAACLLIALLIWPVATQPDSSLVPLATIVSEIDALLTNGESKWDVTELVAGDYQLRRGLLHLRFEGGVMVYVEAPTQFDVVTSKRVVLHYGRLSASVPPEGIGFTVDTPEAEVVDFGTEFSVDVESGTSEVHVFDGLVRVQPKSKNGEVQHGAVDLRTDQAVKVNNGTEKPVDIKLATDRFIRDFDEPKRKYVRSLRRFSPIVFYRMAIRDQGLLSEPPQYSGYVLTGEGSRPPHARGVFAGGSLRVGDASTGRGGRVEQPPSLTTGQFTLAVFVYLDAPSPAGMIATNIGDDNGNFALSLNENGVPQAKVREIDGELRSLVSDKTLPQRTWRHIVVTADGDQLRLYEDGQPAASAQCESMATSTSEAICFGAKSSGVEILNGRIDELALFDHALSDFDIAELYQAALEEMARSE